MKNLKKLTRLELKNVNGGFMEPGTWKCCMTDGSGRCSTTVSGDSDDLMCVTPGTILVKA